MEAKGCGVGANGWGVGQTPTVMGVDRNPPSPRDLYTPLEIVESNCSSSLNSSISELLSSFPPGILVDGVRSSGLASWGEGLNDRVCISMKVISALDFLTFW